MKNPCLLLGPFPHLANKVAEIPSVLGTGCSLVCFSGKPMLCVFLPCSALTVTLTPGMQIHTAGELGASASLATVDTNM